MTEFLRWGPEALRQGYATIPLTVMYDNDLPTGPKILYGVIAGHLWGDHLTAWPSQARLAEYCGVTTCETIRKWTRELESRGLLTTTQRPDNTLIYELHIPPAPQTQEGTLPNSERGPSPTRMGGEVKEGNQRKGNSTTPCSDKSEPTLTDAAKLKELRDGVPSEDLDLIDEFLDNCAAENKSNQITMGRRKREMRTLLKLKEKLGDEPWRYGMEAANNRKNPDTGELEPATHENYVKVAAGSWSPTKPTAYDKPAAKKPVSNNPTGKTIVGWDALDEVTNNDD